MPAYARRDIVRDDEVVTVHCIQRCVRRAALCGHDPFTGLDRNYRRGWIEDRLKFLAKFFAVEVQGFAVMSNHTHTILRTRPDLVKTWSDNTVIRRWLSLCPKFKDKKGLPIDPTNEHVKAFKDDALQIEEWRYRLGNLSWFMRLFAQHIARRCNSEDNVTGRFWEGRFKSSVILDEQALLTCCAYIDLNPVRAGMAKTPETSIHTSAYLRLADLQEEEASKGSRGKRKRKSKNKHETRSAWLSPIDCRTTPGSSREKSGPIKSVTGLRATDDGMLSVTLKEYALVLDFCGREIRGDKSGAIPPELAPILERLGIEKESWSETVENFGRWFHRAVGSPERLQEEAKKANLKWMHGMAHCRNVFS